MAKLVTIFGGSGFVGRQVARLMAKEGWRVRIAVRRPDEALFTRTYGAVGQVQDGARLLRARGDDARHAVGVGGRGGGVFGHAGHPTEGGRWPARCAPPSPAQGRAGAHLAGWGR